MILSRLSRLSTLLLAALTLWSAGCSGTREPAIPTGQATNSSSSKPQEQDRDLRLFGRQAAASDIGFEGKAATDVEQHTFAGEGADFDPDIDPAGRHLVFASTRHSPRSHLYIKAIGAAAVTQITDESGDDVQPAFSPSGKQIAFASNRAGQWDIWIVDANGKNPKQIAATPMPELHPSWSPDGRRLVYCRLTNKNHGELWVVDLENPGAKRFIGEGLFPDWSPNGDKIVYQRARQRGSGQFSIWTLDIRDDEVLYPTEIASSSIAAYISPSWSADGEQIAFASVALTADSASAAVEPQIVSASHSDILVVDADGRGLQRLTDGRGANYSPVWASDDRIFFTAKTSEAETIWSIRLFRPCAPTEPSSITAGNRRAAQVLENDGQ